MRKFFWGGFLAGVFFVAAVTVLFSKQEELPEEILYYEDELSEREGYQELSDEQKRRIETLKGDFQIGEMVIFTSGFNYEWYETQKDTLIKQEIVFKNINEVYFDGERYQAAGGIYAYDKDYYFGLRYYNAGIYLGEKEAVQIWFQSLDDNGNAFALILAANGNIFFQPGELVHYGFGNYTYWGMYEVLPAANGEIIDDGDQNGIKKE